MKNGLTNLLPIERRKSLKSEYWMHVATIGVFAVAFLLISATLLRAPLYIYEVSQVKIAHTELDSLTSQLNDSGGSEVNARLKKLNSDAATLGRLATSSQATSVVSAVLGVDHAGIITTGLSYTPASKGQDGKLTINGTATTREALRAYVNALGSQPFVKKADLPISAYAKDSDIPFTITLSGSFAL